MERIGFIGLGTMGKPMARNLVKAGYPLVVHNRSLRAVEELAQEGARAANSPAEVAAASDILITMLPDSADVELVVAGPRGVLSGSRPGMLLIDMSTISPVVARRLASSAHERGVEMLDAPVSGGEVGAINGTLSIMVGGQEQAFNRALVLFQRLGKTIVLVGASGAGQVTKAANQIVVALTIEAISEALVLATKAGVDPAKVRQVLLGGFAQSRVLDILGQRMLNRDFNPGFRANLHRKDLGIALATASEYLAPLPLTAEVYQMMTSLLASGQGNLDHSILVSLIEDMARAQVK